MGRYSKIKFETRVYLMEKLVSMNLIRIPIPPVEKNIDKTVEMLIEIIYGQIEDAAFHTELHIENLRLEVSIMGDSFNRKYQKQFVSEKEVYLSYFSNLPERVSHCMVTVNRDLTKILTEISLRLYP